MRPLRAFQVSVEAVAVKVVGAEHVPHPVGAGVGGPPPPARAPTATTAQGPLATGMGLEVQGPELIDADHHRGVIGAGLGDRVGDRVQLQDPVLLALEVRVR